MFKEETNKQLPKVIIIKLWDKHFECNFIFFISNKNILIKGE